MKKFLLLSLMFVITHITGAIALTADEAKEFVRQRGEEALQQMGSSGLDDSTRRQRFVSLFTKTFDQDAVARKVLGPRFNELSSAQNKRFKDNIPHKLARMFANNFKNYTPQDLNIGRATELGNGQFSVAATVTKKDGSHITFNWTVNAQKKLVDLEADGVTIKATVRADLEGAMDAKGIEGMISDLEQLAHRN